MTAPKSPRGQAQLPWDLENLLGHLAVALPRTLSDRLRRVPTFSGEGEAPSLSSQALPLSEERIRLRDRVAGRQVSQPPSH